MCKENEALSVKISPGFSRRVLLVFIDFNDFSLNRFNK